MTTEFKDRRVSDFVVKDIDDLKTLYLEAAIETYGLKSLRKYVMRASDIAITSKEYRLGEGALIMNSTFFIPKSIMITYFRKNRQN
jgi:hypothetical protein